MIQKLLINSYHIQCFTFQSPIDCSLLPINNYLYQQKEQTTGEKQSKYVQKYSLTVWDQNNQIKSFILTETSILLKQQVQETLDITVNEDIKINKFGIIKSFTFANFSIILDVNKTVTVSKQCKTLQTFTDIIQLYQYLPFQSQQQQNFFIFIMIHINKMSKQLMFLVIQSRQNQSKLIAQEQKLYIQTRSFQSFFNKKQINESNQVVFDINLNKLYFEKDIFEIKLSKQLQISKWKKQFPFSIQIDRNIHQNGSNNNMNLKQDNCIYFKKIKIMVINDIIYLKSKKNKEISQLKLSNLSEQQQFSKKCKFFYHNNKFLWILDQNQMILHRINLQILIKNKFLNKIEQNMIQKWDQLTKSHYNTTKILNLRLKILKLMKKYLTSSINPDFSSCFRLLNNQQNPSILTDCVNYLINFIISTYSSKHQLQSRLNSFSLTINKLEQNLLNYLSKLIQSKYQSHILIAMQNILKLYDFTKPHSKQITYEYLKISESKRIQKLLNQDKKELFQLAYKIRTKLK